MDDDLRRISDDRNKPRDTNFGLFVRKLRQVLRTAYRIVSSSVGLLLLLIAYSFLGAYMIRAVESPHELAEQTMLQEKRSNIVSSLGNLSALYVKGDINQTTLEAMVQALLIGYEEELGVKSQTKWTFWGSLFFCGTIYTTIGYGHIAPSTTAGRVVTMVYATFGIPLALIVLADLGRQLMVAIKFLWSFVRRFYLTGYCKRLSKRKPHTVRRRTKEADSDEEVEEHQLNKTNSGDLGKRKAATGPPLADVETYLETDTEADVDACADTVIEKEREDDSSFSLPFVVAIAIVVVYIILGSFMYLLWEDNWDFLRSFYFIFISISTIGFGDVIPEHPKFFLLSSIYIFIGLSLVSMCVNVAIEVFTKTIDKAKEKVDQATTKAKETIEVVGKTLDRAKDAGIEKMQDVGDKLDKAKTKMSQFAKYGKSSSRDTDSVGSEPVQPGPVGAGDLNGFTKEAV
ncbi:potassium channel subfamily K member 18-like [Gigantopelta aegis]|uniref:potassium channel subfamily K member 18-like n=1 Tax=Gigantopelta aegis TaxID=1735272 RepID=UPI001B88CDC0|nr:potassium channel subfamily K member 18-like [Gigantopelta aegis]